ncbi:components of type IV pilus, pilin subunit [Terrihabitans soli]|uniref:Components of type IV pilus, pilin subunit n=1 Tax=Terrihabitans soli TaxID=708113 RepID=A0A6S6QR29_9HYPH|nr:Flp family type IVb pilin [Terrihabitans soli]BCJ92036.1 components of type IV pilus, pilin subunit [Terrihabitans soli]
MTLFTRFLKDESGATAIEYGLIAAIVSVAIIAALQFVGGELGNVFNYIGDQLENAQK